MLEIMLKKISKSKNQKGFTLVELIVVIAILGILAAVAVGRFGGVTTTAKQNADYAAAATIASAAQAAAASGETITDLASLKGTSFLENKTYKSQVTDAEFVLSFNGENPTVTNGTTTIFPK